MGRFDTYQDYFKYINPNTEQGKQMKRYTGGNYNPYAYTAPQSDGGYRFAEAFAGPEAVNPLDYQYTPTALESTMQGLQYGKMGMDILGSKWGETTLGQSFFPNMGKTGGAGFGSPLTQNVSANPSWVPEVNVTPGGGAPLTAGQQASNYFQNVGQGSVSAGLPMYIAGRLVRSAFDDDDPTTFTGGEMLGAGLSGAGAGSALAGMLGIAGPAGWVIGLGISLFGGKRKRDKARKAQREWEAKVKERKEEIMNMYQEGITESRSAREQAMEEKRYMEMQSKYDNVYGATPYYEEGGLTPKEKKKIASLGRNGDTELAHITKQEAELLKYLGGAGTINPKTGLREYHFKWKVWKRSARRHNRQHLNDALSWAQDNVLDPVMGGVEDVMGGVTDTIDTAVDTGMDVLQGGAELATDVASAAGDAAFTIMEETGATDVLDAGMGIVKEGLEHTVVPLAEGIGRAATQTIDLGLDVVGDAVDFGLGMADDVLTEFGEQVAFPVIDFVGDFVTSAAEDIFGIGGGDNIEVPDLPPIEITDPNVPIKDPNIVTVDPYSGRPITETGRGVNFASGSMGFIGPEADEFDDYSAQQSTA